MTLTCITENVPSVIEANFDFSCSERNTERSLCGAWVHLIFPPSLLLTKLEPIYVQIWELCWGKSWHQSNTSRASNIIHFISLVKNYISKKKEEIKICFSSWLFVFRYSLWDPPTLYNSNRQSGLRWLSHYTRRLAREGEKSSSNASLLASGMSSERHWLFLKHFILLESPVLRLGSPSLQDRIFAFI